MANDELAERALVYQQRFRKFAEHWKLTVSVPAAKPPTEASATNKRKATIKSLIVPPKLTIQTTAEPPPNVAKVCHATGDNKVRARNSG